LLHGFPTSSWDWAALWPALVARHRVIAFDFLGFGLSDKPRDGDYTIAHQADIAEAVLAHHGVDRYALLAHDYGDTIAQELLARQLDGTGKATLQAAVLLNGGLFPETHRPVLLQRLLIGPLGPLVARLSNYRGFASTLRRICTRPWAEIELRGHWQLLIRADGRRILPKLIRYMDERRRHRARWVGALQRTTVPVRVIDGLEDPISGAHMVARYRELILDPDVIGLPGVGHYPQVEAPEEVVAAIGDFFERSR
jgi:pimeloyl-ACP methyl ester carboxylesterase